MNNKRKDKAKTNLGEKRLKAYVSEINEVKNPQRNSIIGFAVWLALLFIFAISMHFVNKLSFAWNFGLAGMLGVAISLVWVVLRTGLLEGPRLKLRNWRNQRIAKTVLDKPMKVNTQLSIDDFRKMNKKRSWWGVLLLLGSSALILIITMIIYYA